RTVTDGVSQQHRACIGTVDADVDGGRRALAIQQLGRAGDKGAVAGDDRLAGDGRGDTAAGPVGEAVTRSDLPLQLARVRDDRLPERTPGERLRRAAAHQA